MIKQAKISDVKGLKSEYQKITEKGSRWDQSKIANLLKPNKYVGTI